MLTPQKQNRSFQSQFLSLGFTETRSQLISVFFDILRYKFIAIYMNIKKLAKKLNSPIIFAKVNPKSHGYYEIEFELLTDNPKDTKEGEITNLHSKKLEEDINNNPAYWLWSHRRWKHLK